MRQDKIVAIKLINAHEPIGLTFGVELSGIVVFGAGADSTVGSDSTTGSDTTAATPCIG